MKIEDIYLSVCFDNKPILEPLIVELEKSDFNIPYNWLDIERDSLKSSYNLRRFIVRCKKALVMSDVVIAFVPGSIETLYADLGMCLLLKKPMYIITFDAQQFDNNNLKYAQFFARNVEKFVSTKDNYIDDILQQVKFMS